MKILGSVDNAGWKCTEKDLIWKIEAGTLSVSMPRVAIEGCIGVFVFYGRGNSDHLTGY